MGFLDALRCAAACILAVLFLADTAGSWQTSREAYERAQMLDQSNQNLSEAIRLYTLVVSQARDQHPLAARAQFRIGLIYERLGRKAEALKAFKALVSLFPDQTELVRRARLKILAAAPPPAKPPDVEIIRSGPSLDGRQLCAFTFRAKHIVHLARPVIDAEHHRLYIATASMEGKTNSPNTQSRANSPYYTYYPSTLAVIDTDSNAVAKVIALPVLVSDLGLAPARDKLYATALANSHLRVIDLHTYAQSEIHIDGYPGSVCINPETNRIYVTSQGFGGNDKLFVIDANTDAVTARLDLGGVAGDLRLNPATNLLYVWSAPPIKTRVFNGYDNTVLTDLMGVEVTEIDDIHNRLYGVKRGSGQPSLVVLDGNSHAMLAELRLNEVDYIAVNPDTNRMYVLLYGARQLAVFDTANNRELGRFSLPSTPRDLTFDRGSGRSYIQYRDGQACSVHFLTKGALDEGPEEFNDSFASPKLDPAWRVLPGNGSYSLTENPGHLRYRVGVPSQPRLILQRRFRGDSWVLETKVSYSTGATGGARDFGLQLGFGMPYRLHAAAFVAFGRQREDWNGCCPGETGADMGENGVPTSGVLPANSSDSYVWRIRREGRTLTIERSDDGAVFTTLASHTFTSNIDRLVQFLEISTNSFENKDAYADYEYIRLTKTGPGSS